MTQSTLSAALPQHTPEQKSKCPFCNDKQHSGYTTKHGAQKNEDVLRDNLKYSGQITSDPDPKVGNIYPFEGGGDNFDHWEAAAGMYEDHATRIAAAPHHIIPGDAVMSKVQALETWTTKSKGGKIKEDIGYSIDCTENGIFLPRYPDIFGTKKNYEITDAHGNKKKVSGPEYYGRGTWSELNPDIKKAIAYSIMCETNLQLHQTSHGAKYLSEPNKSYNKEARAACETLADYILAKQMACPVDEQKNEPFDPPYGAVQLINNESKKMRMRMSGGRIANWTTWCTRISEELTLDINSNKTKERTYFKIRKIY